MQFQILGFFDVHPFEIDGTKTLRERAEELARFRESPNFEVLFVSSVGTTGLNLECANILIILVGALIFTAPYTDTFCRMCCGRSKTTHS